MLNHSTLIPRYPDMLRILSEKAGNPAGCEVSSMYVLFIYMSEISCDWKNAKCAVVDYK